MSGKGKKGLAAAAVVISVLLILVAGYYIGIPLIQLAEDPARFRALVDAYGIWGRLIFVGMVVVQILFAFIPGEPIELLAGYTFGFWEGTLLTLAGFLIGSILVFLLVRKYGVKLVEVFFPLDKINQFSFLKNPEKTKTLAFLLMLIPGTPKDFLSYFAGLTQISLGSWVVIVVVGRLPSLITSTATGAAAGQQNYVLTVIMIAVTLVITLAGLCYYGFLCKAQRAAEAVEQ